MGDYVIFDEAWIDRPLPYKMRTAVLRFVDSPHTHYESVEQFKLEAIIHEGERILAQEPDDRRVQRITDKARARLEVVLLEQAYNR